MRTISVRSLALTFCGLLAFGAVAYEPITHSILSETALKRSVLLTDAAKLNGMGLKSAVDSNGNRFANSNGDAEQTIIALIRFGAAWEDNRGFMQATRHFYNPVDGSKLLPLVGAASPDWALEDNGLKDGQAYSYRLMRRNFLKALTDPTKSDRDIAWGLTFQTLGHVMHHLQDMAQPQHVRGDRHCDNAFCKALSVFGAFSPSVFEKRIETNLPDYGDYPAVYSEADSATFNSPRKFWHTNPPGGQATGKGIAEFTNHNFISAGTNFDKPNLFPAPKLLGLYREEKTIAELCAEPGARCTVPGLSGLVTFWGNRVRDAYTGELFLNSRMTTLSVFDAALEKAGKAQLFSYNRFNADAAARILVPRAVGYSAGMINYFFRGELGLVEDSTRPGFYSIVNNGPERMVGRFGLYYDDVNDVRRMHRYWDLDIADGTSVPVGRIDEAFSPAPKTSGQYMLVFNGDMGEETRAANGVGAVAGAVVKLPPSTVEYFYSANIPPIGQCRQLSIVRINPPQPVRQLAPTLPPLSDYYPQVKQNYPTSTTISSYVDRPEQRYHSPVVDRNTGGLGYLYNLHTVINGTSLYTAPPPDGTGPPPSPYALWSGNFKVIFTVPGTGLVDIVGGFVDLLPEMNARREAQRSEYDGLQAAYDAEHAAKLASARYQRRTQVMLSDGAVLASAPYSIEQNGDLRDFPEVVQWSGAGWLQLFDRKSGVYSTGKRPSFSVPPDVCPPTAFDTAPSPPVGSSSQWVADWANARQVADARERVRLKLQFQQMIDDLNNGNVANEILKSLRQHPLSANTFVKPRMEVNVQSSTVGSGDSVLETKVVTLSYRVQDSAGLWATKSEIITGTKNTAITRMLVDSEGVADANKQFTTVTYTNWLPINPTGASELGDWTYVRDDGAGIAQIQNGRVVYGATTINETLDAYGSQYSPKFPYSSDSRVYSYPQIYYQYRAEVARQFDSTWWAWKVTAESSDDPVIQQEPPRQANVAWLDSTFADGEEVELFPLSTVHQTLGDLGGFPQEADVDDSSKIQLKSTGSMTIRYDYLSGKWSLVGVRNLAVPTYAKASGVNFVFRAKADRVSMWPDVADVFLNQQTEIQDTPDQYPFFATLRQR